MINLDKEIIKEKLNFLGEMTCYLFIISSFINSKLNSKISYILLGLGIIKLILFFKEEKPKFNKKIFGCFLFLFIAGLINNFFVSETNGMNMFLRENSEFFYMFFLCCFITSREKLERCSYSLIIGTIILCIFGVYYKNEYFLNGSYGRQRGILIISNIYFMIDFFENILKNKFNIKIIVDFFMLCLSLHALVMLNSRMAVICIVAVSIIYMMYLILTRRKNNIYKVILIMLIGGILSYNILPERYINRLKTSFKTKNNISNEDRIVMWRAGIEIYKNNFITGVGASHNDIKPLLKEYVDKNVSNKVIRNEFLRDEKFSRLHNMYLDFLVQNGIIGLGYIILLLIIIPYEFLKSDKSGLKVPLFFSMISFYVYGITWSLWSDYHIVQILFNIMLVLMLIDISLNCDCDKEKIKEG